MTPREHARLFYWDCEVGLPFWEALHHRSGYVIDTPELFVLGRPVNSKALLHLIMDPAYVFTREESDCWMLWYISGSMGAALAAMPFPLPLACSERPNKQGLQFHDIARLNRFYGKEHSLVKTSTVDLKAEEYSLSELDEKSDQLWNH